MSGTEKKQKYIPLPVAENHNCFGCSPKNESGLHMEFSVNEKRDIVASWLSVPNHLCGWGNIVHGGIISTMLDEAMGWAALVLLGKFVLSKNISVEFFKPIFVGKDIRVEGSVLEVRSDREGTMQGSIYDGADLCAKSSSVCSLFTLDYIKKMGVADDNMLSDLEMLMSSIDSQQT
jgi:acyl-coenzyme A thioesterase PaaI-like protein